MSVVGIRVMTAKGVVRLARLFSFAALASSFDALVRRRSPVPRVIVVYRVITLLRVWVFSPTPTLVGLGYVALTVVS
eukprot:SAG11_NODE_1718_length_4382_cov_2.032687_2_plen_77_part_00